VRVSARGGREAEADRRRERLRGAGGEADRDAGDRRFGGEGAVGGAACAEGAARRRGGAPVPGRGAPGGGDEREPDAGAPGGGAGALHGGRADGRDGRRVRAVRRGGEVVDLSRGGLTQA